MSDATNSAKSAGANIVQIIEVKEPNFFGSSCYRIKAKMYRNLNKESLASISEIRNQKINLDFQKMLIMHLYIFTDQILVLVHY